VPTAPDPTRPNVPAWEMVKVTPAELMGRMAAEVEGGSTGPENVPQQRSDAQAFVALSQDPRVNGEKMLMRALSLYGVEQPEGYIQPPEPQVPADQVQQFLASLGIPPEQFVQFLDQAAEAQNGAAPGQGQPAEGQNGAQMGGPTVNGAMGAATGGEH
jgi:hypothetical protein